MNVIPFRPPVTPLQRFSRTRQELLAATLTLAQHHPDDDLVRTEVEGTVAALLQILQLRVLLRETSDAPR